jgi:large subunit ribosomal protein L2
MTYRAPSHRYLGAAKHAQSAKEAIKGQIIDLVDCIGHSAPLAKVRYEDGQEVLMIAPEGIRVGQLVALGSKAEIKPGNVCSLKEIPEGTAVFNIEQQPGDGGKFCRSSGVFARVVSKMGNGVLVRLPSKIEKMFNQDCRACIGMVAGAGRTEKPFLKAGTRMKAMQARNKLYPITSASAMNACSHPYGNTRSLRKSKARPASRNAPPGRKIGMIAARRTGRRKRK